MSENIGGFGRAQINAVLEALDLDGSWVTEINITCGEVTVTGLPPWLNGARADYHYPIVEEA